MRIASTVRATILAILLATTLPSMALAHGHEDRGEHADTYERSDGDHDAGDHEDQNHGDRSHTSDRGQHDNDSGDHHNKGGDQPGQVDGNHPGDNVGGNAGSGATGNSPGGNGGNGGNSGASSGIGGGYAAGGGSFGGGAGDSNASGHDNRISICHVENGLVLPRKTSDPKAQYLPRVRPDDLSSDFLPDPALGCGPTL